MVLLLDDDHNFREALALLLRDDGHDVADFADPRHVPPLETLPRVKALIIGHGTQGQNGLAFADRFHRVYPTVPIVMVAAYSLQRNGVELGVRPHITLKYKPIEYNDLTKLLPAPDAP